MSSVWKIQPFTFTLRDARYSYCLADERNNIIYRRVDSWPHFVARQDMPEEAWWIIASNKSTKPIGPFDTPERAYAQLRLLGS